MPKNMGSSDVSDKFIQDILSDLDKDVNWTDVTANKKYTGNGGAGGYTYKFIVYNKTTKKWAKLKDFSAVNKLTWKAGSAGERQFYVDVKDSNGTVVRSQVLNVKTTK